MVLRVNANCFNIRGHHNTFYPVELPQWLGTSVMESMVIRFQEILRDEIAIMMQEPKPKHGYSLSIQSTFSVTSNNSDAAHAFDIGLPDPLLGDCCKTTDPPAPVPTTQ
jgi:hypothetical protein